MTYSYYPELISSEDGVDRMRFEIADTDVSGGADSAALSNEEIQAIIDRYQDNFKMAKFKIVEHLLYRYGQDVDNRVGPVQFTFSNRMNFWKQLYDDLKKELAQSGLGNLKPYGGDADRKSAYFYRGMMNNPGGRDDEF